MAWSDIVYPLSIVAFWLFAIVIGYFFNIYVVFALTLLLCFLFMREGRRPNSLPGTSGKMGAMIIGFIALAPFVIVMLITSIIVNRGMVASFFKTIAYYFSVIFLR